MPGMNKTGPMGNGPMTGRRMGLCSGGKNYGAFCGRSMGRGFGNGAGFARGRGFGFNQNLCFNVQQTTPEQEEQFLKEQKEFLQSELEDINNRLENL